MSNELRAEPRNLWWFRANVPCLEACPVRTDAGRYVQLIAQGRLTEAYRVARAPNPIASLCGRTCGAPCEDACRRGQIDAPVAIRSLKRFVTEAFGPESLSATSPEETFAGSMGDGSTTPGHGEMLLRLREPGATGRRIAVVGAGPAGLACAHDLALMGHAPTIFEAMPHPGGMMRYGIPSYRLPREVIDRQVAEIESLGVVFRYGRPLGAEFGITELREQGYEAVFLGIGAGAGRGLDLKGAELDGAVKAIDYLLNSNRGYRIPLGRRVVVVGGGLVALDAARMAMRSILPGVEMSPEEESAIQAATHRVALDAARDAVQRGAIEVTVVSLESEIDLPAARSVQGREELEVSEAEGVRFLPGWGPKEIRGAAGRVTGVELVRCLHAFDESGRFRPTFDPGDTRLLDADTVILAIGQAPDLSFLRASDGVETTAAGTIKIDPVTLSTTAPDVFSGGDAAFPPALLITAAQQGKIAARSIDAYLRGRPQAPSELRVTIEELSTRDYSMPPEYDKIEREVPLVPLDRRSGITEVEGRLTQSQARAQAQRCLSCHTHPIYEGEQCVLCGRCADVCPEDCIRFVPLDGVSLPEETRTQLSASAEGTVLTAFLYDEERCIRCGLCAIRCPTGAITMQRFHFDEVANG